MFGLFESSRSLGQPVYTYLIRYGSGANDVLAFCDCEEDLTIAGVTYQFAQVQHDDIVASGTLDKSSIELRTPRTNPLVEVFRSAPPDSVVTLQISMGHVDDPDLDFKRIWTGRILDFGYVDNEAKFTCEPVGTSLRRTGLRRPYSIGCPHRLFGPQCKASKPAATVSATVSSINANVVTLNAGWFASLPPGKFTTGTLEWAKASGSRVVRTILSIGSSSGPNQDLALAGDPNALTEGMVVDVVLGCNHQESDCRDLHHNIQNFGGCSKTPTANPIGVRNNFY